MFVRHLGPCAYPSYWDMGQIPVSALWGIVYARLGQRWGQRLGQKKAVQKNGTYEKQKSSKSDDFEAFWHAVRDSNPRPSGP